VACLAAYNTAELHGRWINACEIIDDIYAEITEMLEKSPEPGAEEYAIHDYEGFGPLRLSELEPIETVARIAEGIAEHGLAFAHWAALVGTTEDDLESFTEHYLGHWPSMEAYADQLVDDFGVQQELDRLTVPFREYIRVDTEALARDLEIEYLTADADDGVYIWGQP
jgi:antirestriction protein